MSQRHGIWAEARGLYMNDMIADAVVKLTRAAPYGRGEVEENVHDRYACGGGERPTLCARAGTPHGARKY